MDRLLESCAGACIPDEVARRAPGLGRLSPDWYPEWQWFVSFEDGWFETFPDAQGLEWSAKIDRSQPVCLSIQARSAHCRGCEKGRLKCVQGCRSIALWPVDWWLPRSSLNPGQSLQKQSGRFAIHARSGCNLQTQVVRHSSLQTIAPGQVHWHPTQYPGLVNGP